MEIKHFELSEFDSKDIPGSGERMRASTLIKCEATREEYGMPLVISSGYRSPARNKLVGGVANSSHLLGYAVDWKDIESANLLRFLDAAWAAGFRRFGIMTTSIHTDDDATKPKKVIWTYDDTPPTRFKIAQNWFAEKLKTV